MQHVPATMTYGELADFLSDLSASVREGNSLEGFVEYLIGEGEGVDVRARVRTGNLMGQGGMRFIGDLVEGEG